MFDCHIHMYTPENDPEKFCREFFAAGGEEAIIFSPPPPGFTALQQPYSGSERLNALNEFCRGRDFLHPFYWVHPLEDDAEEQVRAALAAGVEGFKFICTDYYPSNPRAMQLYRIIARHGKCMFFHSGILWDGKASGKYSRPLEFECMLEIPEVRFALAHVSWPWCDEAIALYGKFSNAFRTGKSRSEIFLDTTAGTPAIYRQEVLTKLYTVGYPVEDNLLFGSDNDTTAYDAATVNEWLQLDRKILTDLQLDRQVIDKYFKGNMRRFIVGGK